MYLRNMSRWNNILCELTGIIKAFVVSKVEIDIRVQYKQIGNRHTEMYVSVL